MQIACECPCWNRAIIMQMFKIVYFLFTMQMIRVWGGGGCWEGVGGGGGLVISRDHKICIFSTQQEDTVAGFQSDWEAHRQPASKPSTEEGKKQLDSNFITLQLKKQPHTFNCIKW